MTRRLAALAAALALIAAAPASAQQTTPLCHATGDPARPYALVNATDDELTAHLAHEDDIIPAPDEGCPASDDPDATPAPQATATPAPSAAPDATATPEYSLPVGHARDEVPPARPRRGRAPAPPSAPAVEPLAATAPALTAARATGPMPATGADPLAVAAIGLGFLMCGAGGRLLLSRRPA